ncbi:tripartite tricarboxylate transporter substrate-binding protein [Variovorax sp. J22R133]|uniref:tripartite tricarboxylate transporter substrate-binding protein n=1 Tax=Variovorax brevis TaxID=3053503 RepID=UPI002574F391|nr:tripartite tricarboxylate transporter substrate-binding protein [Variovorax sp. J22R133]MDM0117496.1 tripartite tricarboxylate transporter substrate-binding protein [Variovorax sp. J22R133]
MRLGWIFSGVLAAACCGLGANATAQANSASPARILLAFEGGSARAVSLHLAEQVRGPLGRAVIVEERPGAGGRVGAMALKNATPDGSIVALLPIAVPVLAPMTFKDVQYDAAHDFAPVTQIASYCFAFAVPADHPAKSFPDFVEWMKSHPSQAFYGTPAAGSLPHFLGVMISRAVGTDMTHVAYKGFAPMSIDLIGATIPAGISSISDLVEMHKAGRVRILATSGVKREPRLPEVPTFVEQGYPTVQAIGWAGIFAPAKTPRPVIDAWSQALVAALHSPETQRLLLDYGLEPTGTTPEELAAIMSADIARWGPVIRQSGFRAD